MLVGVTRKLCEYLRNIEDIFSDKSSTNLVRKYPKWTCFHIFVEYLISSVIYEDTDKFVKTPGNYWVDALIKSNGIPTSGVLKQSLAEKTAMNT